MPAHRPVNTYRLQFSRGFRLPAARELLPYLKELGITDCYSSPQLRARNGSTHGYDICDHGRRNPELGSEDDYEEFAEALQAHGLGHILDIVPNHMSGDPVENPWWRDVLENGPSSPYASYFDIDWDPIKPELKGKVLLPLLGDQYGHVLERGELQLRFENGALQLHYFDRNFPINPRRAPQVFELGLERLQQDHQDDPALREYMSIMTALRNLPAYTEQDPARVVERQREKEVARERLVRLVTDSALIRDHIEAAVRLANGIPGDRSSFDLLHGLLENQAYRLAYWRTAFDEINYRRFFDINELIGLRMEESAVFEATHRVISQRIAQGEVTGLRIDHPDGLFDPAQYFQRLHALVEHARHDPGERPFYIVAEKILERDEDLRADWMVAGTTGYSFMNLVAGLFIDGRNAASLRRIYGRMTGRREAFDQVAYQGKITIMQTAMASELNVLAHGLNRITEGDRRARDFTLNTCRKVLREVVACFPVYRTYVSGRGVDAFDRQVIGEALRLARLRNPLVESSIFEFIEEVLLATPGLAASGPDEEERLRFAMRFQQFSAPVQAKGVEDTAFYRYHALIAANEVGGDPGRLGTTADGFHRAIARRRERWPNDMSSTSTHDTKRGEDARMRLVVLSEIPDAWRRAVGEWMRINERHRSTVNGVRQPDRNDEYLFYQSLLGIWPAECNGAPVPDRVGDALVDRIRDYMHKATREAKVHTSWIDDDLDYGRGLSHFVEQTLTGKTARRFLAAFVPFQRQVAHVGMVNSLAQLVLKLASPGVADCYQGAELWDFSLVDPDNRRPVDFALRHHLRAGLQPLVNAVERGEDHGHSVRELLEAWPDGRIKLFTMTCGLRFRRRRADVVLDGMYHPILARGAAADHVLAFARVHDNGALLAVVPRLVATLTAESQALPVGAEVWGTTTLSLPESLYGRQFRHLLTGEVIVPGDAGVSLALAEVLRTSPVALLWAAAP